MVESIKIEPVTTVESFANAIVHLPISLAYYEATPTATSV